MQKQVFQGFETPSCDLTLLMADGSFCSLLVQVRCSDQLDHCFGLVVVANIDVVFLDKVDGGRESLVLAGASTETFEKQKTATFSSRKVSVIDQLFQILLPMAIYCRGIHLAPNALSHLMLPRPVADAKPAIN